MQDKLISGDNHIDLTYLPPDLWSSQAPNKWKLLAPRVEEMDDGLHWFVDAAYLGVSEPSASLLWKLQPGKHIIRAVDDLGRADSREIIVTAVE